MDRHEFLHGNELRNQAPRNDGLGSRRQMTAKKPSVLELPVRPLPFAKGDAGTTVGQAHRLPRLHLATGAIALQLYTVRKRAPCRVRVGDKQKGAESKAHKRPNLPCAWHFALCRFAERESATLLKLHGNSRHASAPPPENQRDHE